MYTDSNKAANEPKKPLVRNFKYRGETWRADRLKRSSYIRCRNADDPSDGMSWSVPDDNMSNLAYAFYHFERMPTKGEVYAMFSVIESFRSLLLKQPAKSQRALASMLREFVLEKLQNDDEKSSS